MNPLLAFFEGSQCYTVRNLGSVDLRLVPALLLSTQVTQEQLYSDLGNET